MDPLAKKVKLELLVPRAQRDPQVQWAHLDPWVLLECQEREDARDQAGLLENEVNLETLGNLDPWVPWVLVDLLDILAPQE